MHIYNPIYLPPSVRANLKLGFIEGDEFLTANNIEQSKDKLDELYTVYNDEIQKHEFETVLASNLNENFENLIVDIQRSDIPHIKPVLINYLKFSTARSDESKKLEEELGNIDIEEMDILTDKVILFF